MEKTQTAVDWLVEHLTAIGHLEIPQGSNIVTAIISEAKAMEKEQIIDAYNIGSYDTSEKQFRPEQYYNETYGSKD
jgi:hypothetical protein